jgi:hypothetical protein
VDAAEALVREHLLARGFTEVTFEPDGQCPPDFLVDRTVAVEVRRLNKHHLTTGQPLEREWWPLIDRIQALLESFGPATHTTWWVSYRFKRPVMKWAPLRHRVETALRDALTSTCDEIQTNIDWNFELVLYRSAKPLEHAFQLASICDLDAGGFVVGDVAHNLQLCSDEKARKVAAYRALYPSWWLVLVDQVGYCLSELSRQQFTESVRIRHDWDRVVLVSPSQPHIYWDLPDSVRDA